MKKSQNLLFVLILSCFWLSAGLTAAAQTTAKTAVELEPADENKPRLEKKVEKSFLPGFEADVVAEINLVRREPQIYIAVLEEWKKNYRGSELHLPNRTAIVTNEGAALVDEAIEFLKTLKPGGDVTANAGLVSAAKLHLLDLQISGGRGHKGSDGSLPEERVGKFGQFVGEVGELIGYGSASAREIVIKLILDDGVANRGHRKRLFNENFKLIGLANGDSPKYGNLCVIVLMQDFTETK